MGFFLNDNVNQVVFAEQEFKVFSLDVQLQVPNAKL